MKAVLFILIILFVSFVAAQSDMPIGLQKIIDYNNSYTSDFAVHISFFIAFLAGMLGILSPCILPFLPAYFSYTFKEKKNITWMTLVFFLGFSTVFVSLGSIAGFLGEQTLIVLQKPLLVSIVGIFLIILGLVTIKGKGVCNYINPRQKFKNDVPGTFLFGMFFAIGWTACLGPILAGILGIGAILGNVAYSALLMFFYSLGNLVPLFLLSVFYDRFKLSESKLIKGKMFNIGGRYIHSTNLISGILFILIGGVLLIFKGTGLFNRMDILGTKPYFYSLQSQLLNWKYANIIAILAFAVFIILMGRYFWKKRGSDGRNKKKKNKG